jgi:hypothetical protein
MILLGEGEGISINEALEMFSKSLFFHFCNKVEVIFSDNRFQAFRKTK